MDVYLYSYILSQTVPRQGDIIFNFLHFTSKKKRVSIKSDLMFQLCGRLTCGMMLCTGFFLMLRINNFGLKSN